MRKTAVSVDGKVRAIAGTRAILLALNIPEEQRFGLRGFAFRRRRQTAIGRGSLG